MSVRAPAVVVVDVSIVVKWLLPEPDSDLALKRRHQWQRQGVVAVAPDFLLLELHNVFWRKLKQKEIGLDAPILAYAPTFGLQLGWFPFESLLPMAWRLACQVQISVYDAVYAALAQELNAPFFTEDLRLIERLGKAVLVKSLA